MCKMNKKGWTLSAAGVNILTLVINGCIMLISTSRTCTMLDCPQNGPCSDVSKNELMQSFDVLNSNTDTVTSFLDNMPLLYTSNFGETKVGALQLGKVLLKPRSSGGLTVQRGDGAAANMLIEAKNLSASDISSTSGQIECAGTFLHMQCPLEANIATTGSVSGSLLTTGTMRITGTATINQTDTAAVSFFKNTVQFQKCAAQSASFSAKQFSGATAYQLEGAGLLGCGWIPDSQMCLAV